MSNALGCFCLTIDYVNGRCCRTNESIVLESYTISLSQMLMNLLHIFCLSFSILFPCEWFTAFPMHAQVDFNILRTYILLRHII